MDKKSCLWDDESRYKRNYQLVVFFSLNSMLCQSSLLRASEPGEQSFWYGWTLVSSSLVHSVPLRNLCPCSSSRYWVDPGWVLLDDLTAKISTDWISFCSPAKVAARALQPFWSFVWGHPSGAPIAICRSLLCPDYRTLSWLNSWRLPMKKNLRIGLAVFIEKPIFTKTEKASFAQVEKSLIESEAGIEGNKKGSNKSKRKKEKYLKRSYCDLLEQWSSSLVL